jgi:hypothetical protein
VVWLAVVGVEKPQKECQDDRRLWRSDGPCDRRIREDVGSIHLLRAGEKRPQATIVDTPLVNDEQHPIILTSPAYPNDAARSVFGYRDAVTKIRPAGCGAGTAGKFLPAAIS